MAFETANFLYWASGQGGSIFEAMARNFTAPGVYGPTSLGTRCQMEHQDRHDRFLSTTQGILSGVVLFLFLRHKLTRWREEHVHLKLTCGTNIRQAIYTFLTFIEFLTLSPLFLAVLLTFYLYRVAVEYILKCRYGQHFKGLLDGADVVWAIEDQNSRGMINILASIHEPLLGSTPSSGSSISVDLLLILRKRISGRLMGNYQPHPKMFWKRNVELGYYFWSNQSDLTIEDYIRYLDRIPLVKGQQYIDDRQLRTLLSTINNRQLPGNHTSSWEVLVGRQPLLDESRKVLKYPILFRVHHSLGDGVALMRLLLESIVDKDVPPRWKHLSKQKVMNIDYIIKNQNTTKHSQPYSVESIFHRVWKRVPCYDDFVAHWDAFLRVLWTIYTAPAFFNETSHRQADNNCMHASKMANEKVVSWIHEDNCGSSCWVDIIKNTKRLLHGTRFSDVLLTALSASLESYFSRITGNQPETITVVLPARIEKESPHLKLHNRFSVALQTLPITSGVQLNDANRHYALTKRILQVKRYSDVLRSSSDYMINYWIISKMTSLFPENILRKILKSAHSTLAISNLPGPQQMPRIQGRELNNLCFFIPNLGTTAVGITLLTYGGKIQLGILADRAVIPNEDDAHSILHGIVEEIERMGKLLHEV